MTISLDEKKEAPTATKGSAGQEEYLRLLELMVPAVHRFTAQRVPGSADAADLAQQTLLIALSKLSTFRGGNFLAWLFAIARHLIFDHYRTHKRFQFLELEETDQAETEPALQSQAEAVPQLCECRERLRSWLDCLTCHLGLEQQMAILLADVYGYRDKDSATLLGLSAPSFKLLLHLARTHLNRVAGGHCTMIESTKQARLNDAETTQSLLTPQGRPVDGPFPYTCPEAERSRAIPPQVTGGEGKLNPCQPESIDQANCQHGLKCCRHISRLLALRGRLLAGLKPVLYLLILSMLLADWGTSGRMSMAAETLLCGLEGL